MSRENDIEKPMACDLIDIIGSHSRRTAYTPEEIKALIKAYISGTFK